MAEQQAEQQNENIIKCKIKIQRILFPRNYHQAASGDFHILSVEPQEIEAGLVEANQYGTITVKGNCPKLDLTETYSITAREIVDPKWGKQYELLFINLPIDLTDVRKQKIFLSKIVTELQLKSLYEAFENPFEIIANQDVDKLTKVKGIGVKTALRIIEKYGQTIDYSEAFVELDGYGLTNKMIENLVELFGSPSIAVAKIKENPYTLTSLDGFSFTKADAIALKAGFEEFSPFRIKSFIKFYLNESAYNGNSWVIPSNLMMAILDTIGDVDRDILYNVIHDMPELWWDEHKTKIALKKYYDLELNIAKELIRISNSNNDFNYDNWEEVIKEREEFQGWNFTEEQIEGIKAVLENQLILITGNGGTGKSSIVAGMLDVLANYEVSTTALSGKAAANLQGITNQEGYTIHRLLEYSPMFGFERNKKNPLYSDIVVLDELSMVDASLFLKLLLAIKDGTKLIMLGDAGQLESIGVGNIMVDLMKSGVVKHVNLTKIHRQAAKSAIITEAQKVRHQDQLVSKNFMGIEVRGELQDLELNIYNDKSLTAPTIINYFEHYLEKVNDIMELQVIVPMKNRGDSCTFKLNKQLQEIYNPYSLNKKEIEIQVAKDTSYSLREGDKVLNVKNNYKTLDESGNITPVFNGNVGIIKEIDLYNGTMIIDFVNIGTLIVTKEYWSTIELGYAMTVHKLQGSSSQIAIIGLDYSSFKLLNKQILYTGLTRAKKYCVLCAENSALRYAVTQDSVSTKQTFLADLLRDLNTKSVNI